MDFSLSEIIVLLKKRFVLILICIIIGYSLLYMISRYFMQPIYTASVQMYVDSNDSVTASADLTELTYAQKVVNTYISFLQTKAFFQKVIEDCGLNYVPEQLQGMTSISAVNNTEIFQISVTSYSAKESYDVVNALQQVAPDFIKNIKSGANISIVDPATYPSWPSGPNIRLNATVGGILGFLFSVLMIFLWEVINVRVRNPEDLKRKYDIPIIGIIPDYLNRHSRRYAILRHIPRFHKKRGGIRIMKKFNEETNFFINEAYNSLRTNLRFTVRKEGCKKIVVNSPIPEEGKSTTSSNIAVTLAQAGSRVLLMDCDLRKGTLHNYFNIKSSPGLSDALSGSLLDKDVIHDTVYKNLQVMTMGVIPPNPTELLGSTQMEDLIRKLEKNYDYIIFDTPPVNLVSDVLSLIKMTDGIVIIVREGVTSYPNIANAISKYNFSEANILGFVLNGAAFNQENKSKSKYYYYYRNKKKND